MKLSLNHSFVRPLSKFQPVSALLAWLLLAPCAGASPDPQTSDQAVASTAQCTALGALEARVANTYKDVYRWLLELPAFAEDAAEEPNHLLSRRIDHRFKLFCDALAEFRGKHPEAKGVELIEAPFRSEILRLLELVRRLEVSRHEQPESPEPWSELAEQLLHAGRVAEAFGCHEKTLKLLPLEASYYSDFGTVLLLYRVDAAAHYQLTMQAVFDKALGMYRRGMSLEPENFRAAVALAESYYLVTPARLVEGQAAWEHALKLAKDESERNEATVHLARYAILRGRPNLAKVYLEQVKEPRFTMPKLALQRRILDAEKAAATVTP